MDNNNPQLPTQPPLPSAAPVQKTVFKENPLPEQSSNKLVLWLIIGIVVIILVVGGIYLYLSKQQQKIEVNTLPKTTPAPVVQENLENDLNTINVASPDADFTSIDSDLQQL